jgi:hypothetical protein
LIDSLLLPNSNIALTHRTFKALGIILIPAKKYSQN